MNNAISAMLGKYDLNTEQNIINALKEIFQEIALLGLWRAKFFEHAAFYGGTALRILYGLDRFSEDLDFSLLSSDPSFTLNKYNDSIISELESYGFIVNIEKKQKTKHSAIESAFIKANTILQMVTLQIPEQIQNKIHHMNTIKIKMEVDTNPPQNFSTENKTLLLPIPFSIRVYTKEDLFAGKVHALLCRQWKNRVKGRDWYDFLWYIARNIPVNLEHLKARLIDSGHIKADETFTKDTLITMMTKKIKDTDYELAKQDVSDFISDSDQISLWSQDFFLSILDKLQIINFKI